MSMYVPSWIDGNKLPSVCPKCGSKAVISVVTGTRARWQRNTSRLPSVQTPGLRRRCQARETADPASAWCTWTGETIVEDAA